MPTNNQFASTLNQKPIQAPQVKAVAIKIQKPPGTKQLSFLGGKNPTLSKFDPDLASNLWARALTMKPKGP